MNFYCLLNSFILHDKVILEFWTVVLVIHGILSLVFYSTMFTFFSLPLVQFHGDIILSCRTPQGLPPSH